MSFRSDDVIQASELADLAGVRHAFFTRRGGVSGGIYAGLNAGPGSRDYPANVAENRRRAAGFFDQPPERLATLYQVHSATAVTTDRGFGAPAPEADAVVTAAPGLVCGALSADCAPILLADPEARVVAGAHAGWKGALGGVVAGALEAMARLGADPARTVAVVGPCIGPKSYEVGPEFFDRFVQVDAAFAAFFTPAGADGKRRFDLPGFVVGRLKAAGVGQARWIGRDTYSEPELFFSNRRAVHRGEGDYGRLLSAIMLS